MPAIWAAAIGAVGSIASGAMKKGQSGGSAAPGSAAADAFGDARATQVTSMFDNSGWNVSFGNGSAITAPTTNTKSMIPTLTPSVTQEQTPTSAMGSSLGTVPALANGSINWVNMAVIALVVLVVIKKVKKG